MSTLEEQVKQLQEQLATLQRTLGTDNNMDTTTDTQSAADTTQLHSIRTRPHYDWSPSPFLMELLNLDAPLHNSPVLSDSDRKTIIESYPPLSHLDYRAPATVPTAERVMNKGQKLEDQSLKSLQYLLSAVFRPLDILANELVSCETNNATLERYVTMI